MHSVHYCEMIITFETEHTVSVCQLDVFTGSWAHVSFTSSHLIACAKETVHHIIEG